ncbi:hypothetical protein BDR04DRAFT_42217 [Suillus decipiens]|nr:hypothetical protein BDR04DRAFT_42217 [Suillus decipiens]
MGFGDSWLYGLFKHKRTMPTWMPWTLYPTMILMIPTLLFLHPLPNCCHPILRLILLKMPSPCYCRLGANQHQLWLVLDDLFAHLAAHLKTVANLFSLCNIDRTN